MFCTACGHELETMARFCPLCGEQRVFADSQAELPDVESLIREYFHRGFPYNAIVNLMEKLYGVHMHVRTLKRRLKELGLKRRGNDYDEGIIRELVKREMQGAGSLGGYRYIWHSLRLRHHVNVPRMVVARIMKELDPEGVEERKARRLKRRVYVSRGPNFCWHLDGYDKLKPYGFPIHGCICGYSRRILWLQVERSNNDPRIPARFYLDTVQNAGGCPVLVRSDCGSENVIIAAMQSYFRAGQEEQGGTNAHQYGSSQANQRIEGWWSSFRKSRADWWIKFFKDMCNSSILELGNTYQMECLWLCFAKVLQNELDKVKDHWNSHYIRWSRHNTIPGVPDLLYYLPEDTGATDCLVPVSEEQIRHLEPQCEMDTEESIYKEYLEYVMEEKCFGFPDDEESAFNLFQYLKQLEQ